jgi:hypothetical protein
VGSEDLASSLLVDAVRQRELEALCEELLHVWAADVGGLLDLNNLENLDKLSVCGQTTRGFYIRERP